MFSKVFTVQSISLLLSIYLIPSIQSIDCNSNCLGDISLTAVNEINGAWCYEYATTFNANCANSISGTPKILFGINTDECYINADDLGNKIDHTQTIPFDKAIYDDDTNANNVIGVEFEISATNTITLCIQGTNGDFLPAPSRLSDDSNECISDFDFTPNFCGICGGDSADTACFCNDVESDCLRPLGRPRGDLVCSWDNTNNRCIASEAAACSGVLDADTPCICFWNEDSCFEHGPEQDPNGKTCQWDSSRGECNEGNCIGTNKDCECIEIEQDCNNEIIDFPSSCLWDIDQCIEGTTTSTTGSPKCFDHCGCFDIETECNAEIIDHSLDCIWIDECINATTTTTEFTTTDIMSTEETDMTTSFEPSREPTTREPTITREPTRKPVWTKRPTKVWTKKPTTSWNKPTPKPDCDDKGKGKGKGKKKGGRP